MKTLFPSCLLLVAASAGLTASDWPQWRGPQRNGQFAGPAWPDKLDTNHLRPMWRVELGPSYSGPIVSGARVFTTETKDKKTERVTAFDRHSGEALWRAEWPGAVSVPFFAKSNGDWIRATPACDGERLFVAGMRDVLVCLDARSGQEHWRVDFVKQLDAPEPEFGFVCSPLVDGEAVYVQAGASFVKLSTRTGEILWRTLKDRGGMWGSVFSSPIIATLGGQQQLVVQTREKLAGVHPADGKILWEQPVEAFRGMNILTPVVLGDTLFTSTYGGRTLGFKVTQTNGQFTIREAWRHKAQGYMSTPVVIAGVAYSHLKSQRVMAIEVETGRELWTSDTSFGKYWSLVAQGDRILALDQRGELFLLRANHEKLEALDSRRLTDAETWAHVAVADDQVFVRELNALAVFGWTNPSRPSAGPTLQPEPPGPPRVDSGDLALLAGNWEGELEYLDFGDNRTKASIKANMRCSQSVPDSRLSISLTFVEPGGKTIADQASLEITAEGRCLLFDRGEWTVTRKFRQPDSGGLTLVFERNGSDNDQPARLRNTITLASGSEFTFTREVRYGNGGDYFTRSTYRFKSAGS